MHWLIALLLAAVFLAGGIVAYRRSGHSDGPRYDGPWWRRAWSFLADALGPEPAVAIPEPAQVPPPAPRRMPPPPPPPDGRANGSGAPPDAPPDGPQPFSGAQADLLHAITSLVNRASHGDIRDVRRCIRTLAVAADCLAGGVSGLGRRLAEPDKHYGAEIWEPLTTAGSQVRSGALHLGQSDAMVTSLLRTTVGELAPPGPAPRAAQRAGMMDKAPEFLRPREYAPEGALVRMWRFALRHRHATIPLAVPVALLAAGQVLSRQDFSPVTEDAVAAAACLTTWFAAEKKWDTGPRLRRWRWTSEAAYARATVICASGWLLLAARYGPLTPALEWLLGAFALAWGIPYWSHKRPRGKRARKRHMAEAAGWDRWWQSHAPAWGLAVRHVPVSEDGTALPARSTGSYVADFTEHAGMVSLLIQLWKGRQTVADIKRVLPLVESALGGYVAHGMTRCEVNKADPSQVWLHLKREDPLREEIPWAPSMVPADIREASPLGLRESGNWLKRCLLASFFILGRSRWGKSNEQSVMLATITGCRNSRAWLIDMKGGRATRPWLPAVDWVATTTAEADLMLACGIAEIKARGTYAYSGQEQLDPTPEVPALFLDIDETYEVTSEMSGSPGAARRAGWLATIASQGQGLAVYTIVLTQYGALEESVGTEQTRLNLNVRMCFQTERREHGTFALGDDANNTVDTTKLKQKGTFYYRADSETIPEQIRGPLIEHDQVREIAERNAERTGVHRNPLLLYCGGQSCPLVPGKTWQQVYDERWSRLPAAFHADAPQGVTLNPSPAAGPVPVNKINSTGELDAVDAEIAAINADVDELQVTEADVERAAASRAARGAPPVDLRTEGDRRRRRFAVALQEAPAAGIGPAALKAACGLGRTWVHQQLSALVEHGAVVKVADGRYRPEGNVLEAMEAIRREGDRLGEAAKEMVGSPP